MTGDPNDLGRAMFVENAWRGFDGEGGGALAWCTFRDGKIDASTTTVLVSDERKKREGVPPRRASLSCHRPQSRSRSTCCGEPPHRHG
jgi:hypothetical protein